MTTTTSSSPGISQRTNVYAAREMLKHAAPVVVLDKFGMMKPMPQNKSSTIKFRRPKTFTAATTPLVEGVTPSATAFQYEDKSATLKQYGQVVTITDVNGVGAAVQFACRSEQGAGVCQHGVSGDLTGQHRAARCQPTVANRWLRPVDKARRRDTGGRVRNSRDSGSPGFPLASASISRDSMG